MYTLNEYKIQNIKYNGTKYKNLNQHQLINLLTRFVVRIELKWRQKVVKQRKL